MRVSPDGALSTDRHPVSLGSPLTHPHITTDFSEAQLELITAVHPTAEACLDELNDIHRFVYSEIKPEVLWPASMPCILADHENIPLGQYGTSNIATAKTVYRRGLGNRYGRLMQTISGIHYNFSVSEDFWQHLGADDDRDYRTARYFGLIRNFRRYSWLLIYLFGASPAICRSFNVPGAADLEPLGEGTLYLPHATSLRMGRLGYQSEAQSSLHISYNNLPQYADTMRYALTQNYPPYDAIGLKVDGTYQQLNTALLQIENEFYGSIRPKRPVQSGERPLTALTARGVEYVEVRCMDLNPFLRVGIGAHEIRFLDTFLIACLLADSPDDSREESERMYNNQLMVVERGRAPGLTLATGSGETPLADWATTVLETCAEVARALDRANDCDLYTYALELQRAKVRDPALTPSAQVLAAIEQQRVPFFRFAMNQALAHRGYFDAHPLRQTPDNSSSSTCRPTP